MTIQSAMNSSKGNALCTCSVCHKNSVHVSAKLGRSGHANKLGAITNMSTVHKQLRKLGWNIHGNVTECPDCYNQREQSKMVTTKQELRKPSKEQMREIVAMLTDVYDTENERYKGMNTDQSVADDLQDGILWGWVAEIRENMFGPDGNEAATMLVGDIKTWIGMVEEALKQFKAEQAKAKELDVLVSTGKELIKRAKL